MFTVHAKSGRPGERSFRADKTTKKDAVEAAVGLLGQGMEGVTITDEAGRVYGAPDFDKFLFDEDF